MSREGWQTPHMAQPIYVGNLREGLEELASLPLQRQLWLSAESPCSFVEAVCQTYDDSGLSDAIDSPATVEALGADAVRMLQELSRALTRADDTLSEYELIVSEPMDRVRELAAAAIAAIGREPA
jgi:hypothetical protein